MEDPMPDSNRIVRKFSVNPSIQKLIPLYFPFSFRLPMLLFFCLLPVLLNFFDGFGENIDSYLIFNIAENWWETGYIKSRSWGFPAYELFSYPLIYFFGVYAGKLFSFSWVGLSVFIFYRHLKQYHRSRWALYFGPIAFAFLPCTVISGNTVLETAQGVSLALFCLYFAHRTLIFSRAQDLFLAFAFGALAATTRLDYIILVAAFSFTLLIFGYFKPQVIGLLFLLSGVMVLAPYLLLYDSNPFSVGFQIINTRDPVWMRLIKAGMGYAAVIGLPAFAVLLSFFLSWLREKVPKETQSKTSQISLNITPFGLFFLITSPFYLIRMVLLPDEIEYIYPYAVFLLIMIFGNLRNPTKMAFLTLALALPNIFQVHLFSRSETGKIAFQPGFSPGVFEQERQRRLLNEFIRTDFPPIAQRQADQLGCQSLKITPYDVFTEKFPKATQADCVLASVKWYSRMRDYVFPNQDRNMERLLGRYKIGIIVHSLPTDRGWRRFLEFEPSFPVKTEYLTFRTHPAHQKPAHCFWVSGDC